MKLKNIKKMMNTHNKNDKNHKKKKLKLKKKYNLNLPSINASIVVNINKKNWEKNPQAQLKIIQAPKCLIPN